MTPARNRVTPLGEIEAFPLRGAWTGNRGILHRGREIVRFHASDLWIVCALEFRGRWRAQWQPTSSPSSTSTTRPWRWRRDTGPVRSAGAAAYNAYRDAWAGGLGVPPPAAKEINRQLHGERIVRGTHRRRLHQVPWADLPDGAFVLRDEAPALVARQPPRRVDARGIRATPARPQRGKASAITPPATLAALRAGYPVQIDPSAHVEPTL